MLAIESCATDIHRLDYRCYIIPSIRSEETETEKLVSGKATEDVSSEHHVICDEAHGKDIKRTALSTDTVSTGTKLSKKKGSTFDSDESEETNVRLT